MGQVTLGDPTIPWCFPKEGTWWGLCAAVTNIQLIANDETNETASCFFWKEYNFTVTPLNGQATCQCHSAFLMLTILLCQLFSPPVSERPLSGERALEVAGIRSLCNAAIAHP